jgi:hypothetical protein
MLADAAPFAPADVADGAVMIVDVDRLTTCQVRLLALKSDVYDSLKARELEWGVMHRELLRQEGVLALMQRAFLEKVQLPMRQTDWADRLFFHSSFYTDPTIFSQVLVEFARDMLRFLELQELSRQFIVCGKRRRRYDGCT